MNMFLKAFTLESLKNFFRVRDENDEYDPEQAKATAIQTLMMLITFTVIVTVLWYTGVI